MIPIDQTVLGAPDGNCMSAAIASVLERPIDTLPHFGGDRWLRRLEDWLRPQRMVPVLAKGWPDDYNGYGVGLGMGPRGLHHAVVVENAMLVHDPHPSRAGLVEWYGYVLFYEG